MSVLKKKITEDFTCVHNAFIRDTELSIAAKGLLLVMLSLPDNWNFSIVGLQSILPDGKDRVRTTLKDLEKKGYLRRNRICDEKGIVTDWEYCFSDEPIFKGEENSDISPSEPESENPNVDKIEGEPQLTNPHLGNPHVDEPHVDSPHTETSTAYKILTDKILNDQIRINQTPCGSTAPQTLQSNEKTENKPKKTSSKKKDYDDEVYDQIIGYLNDKAHTNYRAKAEGNRQYIRARLNEGYSVDDFKKVIDRKCAQWLNRPDMVIYLRPETLFGNKFDGYLNTPEAQGQPHNTQTVQQPGGKTMMELLDEYLEE